MKRKPKSPEVIVTEAAMGGSLKKVGLIVLFALAAAHIGLSTMVIVVTTGAIGYFIAERFSTRLPGKLATGVK